MTPLPHHDLLSTIGEVAAAFVGFSLVVSLLRPGSDQLWRFVAIRDVAELGLIAVGAAFLPLAVHAYNWSPDTT